MSLTQQEALDLFRSDDLIGIGMAAMEVRRAKTDPRVVTYQIDRNINYTNFCTEYCSFCAFYRPLGSKDGYLLSFETIYQKIEEMLDVALLEDGLGMREVARKIGCSPASVSRWQAEVQTGGKDALRAKPPPGRPPRLTARQRTRLVKRQLKMYQFASPKVYHPSWLITDDGPFDRSDDNRTDVFEPTSSGSSASTPCPRMER